MIKLSGKYILKFLQNHYEFVQDAFNYSKPDFIIDTNILEKLIEEYNISNDPKISVTKLIDVKFCRQLPTKDFKINRSYADFLQFLFDDFTLDLPQTLKERYKTIFELFTALKTEPKASKTIVLIQNIINIIDVFLNDIHRQTQRLLSDTESLKVNADEYSDLSKRLEKAVFWIDEYIEPLNKILEKGHPESFYSALVEIQKYTSEKRYIADSFKLKREYEKLYGSVVYARIELDQNLQKLTKELRPLLDRIKSDSIILSGFYHFVENIDYPENYIVPIPSSIKKTRGSAIFKEFHSEAEFFVDQFNYKTSDVYYEEQVEELEWLPDSTYFKKQLLKEDKVDNFYLWCYDALKMHTNEITLSKYFALTNLLLEEDLVAEYSADDRIIIDLKDASIKIPKVKVYERVSK